MAPRLACSTAGRSRSRSASWVWMFSMPYGAMARSSSVGGALQHQVRGPPVDADRRADVAAGPQHVHRHLGHERHVPVADHLTPQLGDGRGRDQRALAQDRDPVGDGLDLGEDVRGQEHGAAASRLSRTRSRNSRCMSGSSPVVGSSRTSRSGSCMNAWTMPTFCRLPWDSCRSGGSGPGRIAWPAVRPGPVRRRRAEGRGSRRYSAPVRSG